MLTVCQDLNKKTEDEETKADLMAGCEAAERVLSKANEAVNRDLLDEALDDLVNRVDDWKNHQVESFGRLLMHGIYGVITGKTDQEKDVRTNLPYNSGIATDTTPSSSMRYIFLKAFCSVAKRSPRIRARIRRTRPDLPDPSYGTSLPNFISRAEFSCLMLPTS